ncbi:amidohydrolase family protein [Glacieibacterium frigidum]|uniref:Amidohydrolase family protein n=1 Tax=Glacieibacterium frigidum TaxID=2593303 RepID=A0A552UI02_9SPHN|nr:amidohydrolase family protein [Glacieibacterium frigidum]TRW17853.1 amidohydrolase family protein [Glacieibacterium frigidum]
MLAAVFAMPATAETVAIVGGTVVTGNADAPIVGGTVIIDGGKIRGVGGSDVAVPAGARVIDAKGKWVTPGIFAGMSFIGAAEVNAVDDTNETRASKSPFSAAIDLSPGINSASSSIAVERLGGITRAAVTPIASREIFAGQGVVISLAKGLDTVTTRQAFQFVELGENGAETAGGSRPVAYLNFRNALREAIRYAANPGAYTEGRDRDALLTRMDVAALVPVVKGQQRLLVHVESAQDILNVLALRTEFENLKLVLVGVREGWRVAPQIAAARVPVIVQPMLDNPNSFEALASTRSNAGRLVAAGVNVALGILEQDASFQARNLTHYAGNLVAQAKVPGGVGLTWAQAMRTITSAPASIFGMSDTGFLGSAQRADVVVWDGDPLELTSAPTDIFIDGVAQPMTSRQTELRDRYLGLRLQDAPLAYRR